MKTLLKISLFAVLGVVIYYFACYQTPEQKEFKKTFASAEKGDSSAQLRLGDFYVQGYGTKSNPQQALAWYRKSLQDGNTEASWKLAQFYVQQQNWNEAAAYLQLAAQDGQAAAQNELGHFYEEGLGGLPKHKGQAFYWRNLAAQHGNQNALMWLKKIEREDPNFYEQEKQFLNNLQLAQNEEVDAMLQVARAYQFGVEILPDMQQAKNWLNKAWQQGQEPQVGYELAKFYLTKENVLADEEQGISLLAELANIPYAPAQYDLGERAYQQEPPNYKDAFAWFSNAAANGLARGQYMTGVMLMQGQGMTRSVPLSIQFFEQAAAQEDPSAQYVLGQIYYKGLGVTPNRKKGEEFLQRAAKNGSVPAQSFLENISK